MGVSIVRGSTPTLKFTPQGGVNVSNLGTPTIGIRQDMVFIELTPTVNTSGNYISASMTEEQTLRLVPGIETQVQAVWKDQNDNVYRFPVHYIEVLDTVIDAFGGAFEPAEVVIDAMDPAEISDPAIPEEDDEIIVDAPAIWAQDDAGYSDEDYAWSDTDEYQIPL